jgi:predicted ATPase/DNA-binding XRE family transcriptional regulator
VEKQRVAVSAFGALLRRHRLAAGLSQEALAERARVSVNGISALERGDRRSPYRETVVLLAKALSLTPAATAELEAAAERPRKPRDRSEPAAGRSGANPHNLRLQLSAFLGRETELAEITALLEAHRLVTLVGAGGIGKTRASLEVAAGFLDRFPDGVWFIELAPLASGDYLPATVACELGLTLAAESDALGSLVNALRAKHALLVFDNCEHLIESTARAVAAIVAGCAQIRVLATSRQGLRTAGEATYRMPSLRFPTAEDEVQITASNGVRYEAIQLFVACATAADQRFVLSDETAPAIAGICRRLDGIPLAIELAAARVRFLGPRQLSRRLDERFRMLTRGSRDALPRQQTLRALIDWSYDLLDESEQRLFRRLAIFANAFTLEGANSIGGAPELDEFEIFDLLSALADKSLVQAELAGDELRYRLLESTRLYAREKLELAGEWEGAARRHVQYLRDRFAALSARREETGRDAELDDALAAEVDDVRAALDWALHTPEAQCGGELLASIGYRWAILGRQSEGRDRLEAFASVLVGGDPSMLSRLWAAFARLAIFFGPAAAPMDAATKAVALARTSGDSATLVRALHVYARNAVFADRLDAAEAALAEAETFPASLAALRNDLVETRAFLSNLRGDLDAAADAYEDLRDIHRRLGNAILERKIVLLQAETEHWRRRTRRAIELVAEVLPDARAGADRFTLTVLLANFAGYLASVDELAAASEAAREVIRERAPHDPEFHATVANSAEHLALVIALSGHYGRAARIAGYADAAPHPLGFVRTYTETTTHDRLLTLLRAELAPDDLRAFLTEGARLFPEAAVALMLEEPE